MSNVASSILCGVNNHIVTIYAGLVVFALLAQVIPFLKAMVLHGKLRQHLPRPLQSCHCNTNNDDNSRRLLVEWIVNGKPWMVRKQRFLHFYMLGTVALAVVRWHNAAKERWWSTRTVAQGLLLSHLLRRWYECLRVHQWQSTSYMHVSVYVVALLYYALLPFIVCRLGYHCAGEPEPVVLLFSQANDESSSIGIRVVVVVQVVSFVVCLYGQYQQSRHHLILANLRRTSGSDATDGGANFDDDEANNNKKRQSTYALPKGGWFRWVACPHYLAEIIFYIGLAGVLQDTARGGIVVVWVATCLLQNALEAQKWYQSNIPGYDKLNRKAIIPYWL